VVGRRLAPAGLASGFHRVHPKTELDVVTLFDAAAAIEAVRSGAIDASFRAVAMPSLAPNGRPSTTSWPPRSGSRSM
jgi:hypothetical protein